MSQGSPAPQEEVWWGGLRWVEAVAMQAQRFEDAFYSQSHALLDAEMRIHGNSSDGALWREAHDQRDREDRPIEVPTWSLHMQVATELDFLVLAIRNVLRAQDRLPDDLRTAISGEDALQLLRNVGEHWDETGGPSSQRLIRDHPDFLAGAVAYTGKEVFLGGQQGVPLSRIRAWLMRARDGLVTALEREGIRVPDTVASMVEGDDKLPWPPEDERLRHRLWEIPQIPGHQYGHDLPREVAEDVARLLGERFWRLRERDWTD